MPSQNTKGWNKDICEECDIIDEVEMVEKLVNTVGGAATIPTKSTKVGLS